MKTIALAALAVLGFTQIPLRGLTAEEAAILSHFSLVQQPNGQGGLVPTLVITGVNLQIVNGTGDTISANGTGNLIVGYNEFGNFFGDERTGSHTIVFGTQANFTGSSGLVGGSDNIVNSFGGVILSGERNWIAQDALLSVIAAGRLNEVHGPFAGGSVIVAGSNNRLESGNGVIVGGTANTAAEGSEAVVCGGLNNAASGGNSVVSGGIGRSAGGNGSWAGGMFYSPN